MPRLNWIDNAKGGLIFLVVLGHLLELDGGWSAGLTQLLLCFIYLFHMPAFAFFAGYNFKSQHLRRKVCWLVLLYLLFNLFYYLPFWLTGRFEVYQLLVPSQGLWFLSALAVWMLISSLNINRSILLIGSLLLSILILYSNFDGYIFSIYRTIAFLPFFVAGTMAPSLELRQKRQVLPSIVAIITLMMITLLYSQFISSDKMLFGAYTLPQLGFTYFSGTIIKIAMILAAFAAIYLLIQLTSNQHNQFTRYGEQSLSIYLFHFIAIKIMEYSGKYLHLHINKNLQLIADFALALLLCQLLSRQPFTQILLRIKQLLDNRFA